MNAKQFNKRVNGAKDVATLIFIIGWVALFAIGLSSIASTFSFDRIIGVIILMTAAVIGYNTYKNWGTISKKAYHLKFALPEIHEADLNHWDTMYFLAKMMNLYHKGKMEALNVEVTRLTEEEAENLEEEDEED